MQITVEQSEYNPYRFNAYMNNVLVGIKEHGHIDVRGFKVMEAMGLKRGTDKVPSYECTEVYNALKNYK